MFSITGRLDSRSQIEYQAVRNHVEDSSEEHLTTDLVFGITQRTGLTLMSTKAYIVRALYERKIKKAKSIEDLQEAMLYAMGEPRDDKE